MAQWINLVTKYEKRVKKQRRNSAILVIFAHQNFFRMKQIAIVCLMILGSHAVLGQEVNDTSYWVDGGKFGISFSQVGLTNWAAGGDPSVSFSGLFSYSLKYEKEPHLWVTKLDAGYGAQRIGRDEEHFKKTDDNLILITRYGYQVSNKWYLSAQGGFRTQFYKGYNYENDTSILISAFMAPAYSKMGIGLSYNHNFSESESFSLTFAPLNGKATFVMDDTLSARGDFGVEPGKSFLFQGGMDLSMALNKEILKNVTLTTSLAMFSQFRNMGAIDVNWEMLLWFRINEYLAANISTQLIYDEDVTIIDSEGNQVNSLVQFKEVLGLGLTLTF
jgi:hypothetical protein